MAPKKQEKFERLTKEEDRKKALEAVLEKIEKDYGKGTIMKLGEAPREEVEAISTGIISIDMALGIGGIPKGRIVEIYGPESSGKTTLTLHLVAEAQKAGGVAAFIDAEHALDPDYAKALGVDIDNLLISQPDNGEQALSIVEALVRSSGVDLIIVDSVAALVPRSEIEGNMGDATMGVQARLMSQALRKLTGIISKSNATVVFINQLRANISTTGYGAGANETTTGGRALKFYSSVRIDIRRVEAIKTGDGEVYGAKTKIKIAKNKMAPPFKQVVVDIIYGEGISNLGVIVDMATDLKIIKKSGAWYSCKNPNGGEDIKLGQGKEKAKSYLEEHPLLMEQIKAKIYEANGIDYEIKDVPEVIELSEKNNEKTLVSNDDEEINPEDMLLDDLIIE